LPSPETFLPSDRRGNESLGEYWERKNDEWEERTCFFKGLIEVREAQRIEDQCKRDLEVKRLRKAIEKLNKQNQP
jgi:hypothetical protein